MFCMEIARAGDAPLSCFLPRKLCRHQAMRHHALMAEAVEAIGKWTTLVTHTKQRDQVFVKRLIIQLLQVATATRAVT